MAFVYCLFLMEETNYDRAPQSHTITVGEKATLGLTDEKINPEDKAPHHVETTERRTSPDQTQPAQSTKTYWQKLSIIDKKRPNRLIPMMIAPLRFLAFPVVDYAGLMYGANGLVWSGVLNATAGTVYVTAYGFDTAAIAYAYLGGVAGVVVG